MGVSNIGLVGAPYAPVARHFHFCRGVHFFVCSFVSLFGPSTVHHVRQSALSDDWRCSAISGPCTYRAPMSDCMDSDSQRCALVMSKAMERKRLGAPFIPSLAPPRAMSKNIRYKTAIGTLRLKQRTAPRGAVHWN